MSTAVTQPEHTRTHESHKNMQLSALLLATFAALTRATTEPSKDTPPPSTGSDEKGTQGTVLQAGNLYGEKFGLFAQNQGGGLPIVKQVVDYSHGFLTEPYVAGKVFIPREYLKAHLVAGQRGIIIPLANYDYHQVDYEPRVFEKDAPWTGYYDTPTENLPGSARPFKNLKLFGVRGEFKLFITDKVIRWRYSDGKLSKAFPNPLSGNKGIMSLDGMCNNGLVCISNTWGLMALFSMKHGKSVVRDIKGLERVAINQVGDYLAHLVTSEDAQSSGLLQVERLHLATDGSITWEAIGTAIEAETTIVDFRFVNDYDLLIARKDPQQVLNDKEAKEHADDWDYIHKDDLENIIEWYQIDKRKHSIERKLWYSEDGKAEEVRLFTPLTNPNAYFGDRDVIYDVMSKSNTRRPVQQEADGGDDDKSNNDNDNKDGDGNDGGVPAEEAPEGVEEKEPKPTVEAKKSTEEPAADITLKPYIGNTHLLRVRLETKSFLGTLWFNSIVSPTMSHILFYPVAPGGKETESSSLVTVIGLKENHAAFDRKRVHELRAKSMAEFERKLPEWSFRTNNPVLNTLSRLLVPAPGELETPLALAMMLQKLQKHALSHPKAGPVPKYSQTAHLVRQLRIAPAADGLRVQHIALARFGFHVPIDGFQTEFFAYQRGNPLPSQVNVERFEGLNPIPDLLAFDVCPSYRVFITQTRIVVRWGTDNRVTEFDNPLATSAEESKTPATLTIAGMTAHGRICVHDGTSRLAVINLCTQKSHTRLVSTTDTDKPSGPFPSLLADMNTSGDLVVYVYDQRAVLLEVWEDVKTKDIDLPERSALILGNLFDNFINGSSGMQITFYTPRNIIIECPGSEYPIRDFFCVSDEKQLSSDPDAPDPTLHPHGYPVYSKNEFGVPEGRFGLPKSVLKAYFGLNGTHPQHVTLESLSHDVKEVSCCFPRSLDSEVKLFASPLGVHLIQYTKEQGLIKVYGLLDNFQDFSRWDTVEKLRKKRGPPTKDEKLITPTK